MVTLGDTPPWATLTQSTPVERARPDEGCLRTQLAPGEEMSREAVIGSLNRVSAGDPQQAVA